MPKKRSTGHNVTIVPSRLVSLREALGLSQVDAAYALGIAQSHLSRLERGFGASVGSDILVRMARFYKVAIEYLIGVSDDPTPRDSAGLMQDEGLLLTVFRAIEIPAIRQNCLLAATNFAELDRQIRAESAPSSEEPEESGS